MALVRIWLFFSALLVLVASLATMQLINIEDDRSIDDYTVGIVENVRIASDGTYYTANLVGAIQVSFKTNSPELEIGDVVLFSYWHDPGNFWDEESFGYDFVEETSINVFELVGG